MKSAPITAALVIGNANYQHGKLLKNPINDASEIKDMLVEKLGVPE